MGLIRQFLPYRTHILYTHKQLAYTSAHTAASTAFPRTFQTLLKCQTRGQEKERWVVSFFFISFIYLFVHAHKLMSYGDAALTHVYTRFNGHGVLCKSCYSVISKFATLMKLTTCPHKKPWEPDLAKILQAPNGSESFTHTCIDSRQLLHHENLPPHLQHLRKEHLLHKYGRFISLELELQPP